MLIRRREPVAIVGARRWYLAPQLEALRSDDHDRRGVTALCLALVCDSRYVYLPPHPEDD